MELKLRMTQGEFSNSWLLIVPYGIETIEDMDCRPYRRLLIVPYGIETFQPCRIVAEGYLLIVPYGIETLLSMEKSNTTNSF